MPKIYQNPSLIRFDAVRRMVLAMIAALLLASPVMAAGPNCPPMIKDCGCVIRSSNTFLVMRDLDATATNQTCIEIAASNVNLNTEGRHIFGKNDGTGTGIKIDAGANRVIVEGTDLEKDTPQSEVSQWNIGIEDDGDRAVIARFKAIGGVGLLLEDGGNCHTQPHTPGNSAGGVLLNKVVRSFVGDLNANFNGSFGVMVQQSQGVTLANLSGDQNKDTGIKLVSSNNVSIGPGGAECNDANGITLISSSHNRIHDSNGNEMNGDTGILLTCASGDGCPGNDGSNENRITNAGAPRNMNGIEIGQGSGGNIITVTHNEDNSNSNSDMIDLNPNCGTNIWYNNVGNGNLPCTER